MERVDPAKRSLFIVLEGVDGSGLTTQALSLANSLAACGLSAIYTKEPTEHGPGALIRAVLQHTAQATPPALALLFAADRLQHCQKVSSLLDTGITVICDRYVISSLVYQTLAGCPTHWVAQINRFALVPDLTVFLDVPPDVAIARRLGRGSREELFERESVVRDASRLFRDHLRPNTQGRHAFGNYTGLPVTVNGEGTRGEVAARIIAAVLESHAMVRAPQSTDATGMPPDAEGEAESGRGETVP